MLITVLLISMFTITVYDKCDLIMLNLLESANFLI